MSRREGGNTINTVFNVEKYSTWVNVSVSINNTKPENIGYFINFLLDVRIQRYCVQNLNMYINENGLLKYKSIKVYQRSVKDRYLFIYLVPLR